MIVQGVVVISSAALLSWAKHWDEIKMPSTQMGMTFVTLSLLMDSVMVGVQK